MDSTVSALQNAINRFAAVGGFARIGVDGLWGSETKQGIRNALTWIGQAKCYQTACTEVEDSQTAAGILAQWDESMNAAKGIGEFIAGVADNLGIPHVAAPIVVPSSGGGHVVLPHLQLTIFDRLRALPVWQQIMLGVATGLGLIYVAKRIKASQQQHVEAGRRRRRA